MEAINRRAADTTWTKPRSKVSIQQLWARARALWAPAHLRANWAQSGQAGVDPLHSTAKVTGAHVRVASGPISCPSRLIL